MAQPEEFVIPGTEHKKSLYSLKQSPRCWYQELSKHLVATGFQQSKADPCVFHRWKEGKLTIISIYVDDLILLADIISEMKEVKGNLSVKFRMKDLGLLSYCLGIGITQGEGWLQIQQRQYIMNLLNRFELTDAHPVSTPVDLSVQLVAEDGVSGPADQRLYQRMIGSLQYAAGDTRPDIAQIVGALARYCNKPSQLHLTAAKRVFRYLKGTVNLALTYRATGNDELHGYSDADWAGDRDTRRSSRLRRLVEEMGNPDQEATVIFEDNQGAIATAHNPVFHRRTKHIQIRYHYVREAVAEEIIKAIYCPSSEMTADILTKAISKDQFELLRAKMGLEDQISV